MAKLNHTTNNQIPKTPTETIIHNHAPGYAGIIVVSAVVLAAAAWMAQFWLVSLLARLQFRDPQATFAMLMVFIVFGLPLLFLLNLTLHGWAEARHQHQLELEDRQLDRLTVMHQLQNSVVADTRALDPSTKRRNALIVALVADGLLGNHNFSYRKAGEYTLTGEQKKLGKDSVVVREALTWLRDRAAIKNNKLVGYTSIGQVQRELHNPVLVPSRAAADDDNS